MRNLRKAAFAGATAVAVALGSTTVAVAEDTTTATNDTTAATDTAPSKDDKAPAEEEKKDDKAPANEEKKDDKQDGKPSAPSDQDDKKVGPQPTKGEGSLSSRIGNRVEADQTAYGPAIFGSSKGQAEGEKETFDQQPIWAKILYGVTITASVAAAIGLVFGPLYNYIVHGR